MFLTTFDPYYYLSAYPDVAASADFGSLAGAADHFKKHGLQEGRSLNVFFSPAYYLDYHEDIRAAYGPNSFDKAFKHWLQYGIKEGRRGSLVFDPGYYLNTHVDLLNAYGPGNYERAAQHWFEHGISENRLSVSDISIPIFQIRPDQTVRASDAFKALSDEQISSKIPISEGLKLIKKVIEAIVWVKTAYDTGVSLKDIWEEHFGHSDSVEGGDGGGGGGKWVLDVGKLGM